MDIRAKSGWSAAIRLAIMIILAMIVGTIASRWHFNAIIPAIIIGMTALRCQRQTLSIPPGQIVGLFVAVLVLHAVVVMTLLILNQHRL